MGQAELNMQPLFCKSLAPGQKALPLTDLLKGKMPSGISKAI